MSHGSFCTHVAANVLRFLFLFFLCLAVTSTCRLSLPGLADADENCKRFVDRCMPEAFKKASDATQLNFLQRSFFLMKILTFILCFHASC